MTTLPISQSEDQTQRHKRKIINKQYRVIYFSKERNKLGSILKKSIYNALPHNFRGYVDLVLLNVSRKAQIRFLLLQSQEYTITFCFLFLWIFML